MLHQLRAFGTLIQTIIRNLHLLNPLNINFSGSRLGQIYQARIGLSCSSLRYHLFQKNIIDNPVCECGEVQKIFFLHCNLSGQLRHELLDRVLTYCQPTANIFLYGNTDLSDVENAELYSALQYYILIFAHTINQNQIKT